MTTIDDSWYQRPEGIPLRRSAGGVVVRIEAGDVLLALAREANLSGLVLPKGGVDSGETDEQAARREIDEEAGISQLELLDDLGRRSRLSFDKRRWIDTHYFLFRTEQSDGTPADSKRHEHGPTWRELGSLDEMFWPEQRELVQTLGARIRERVLAHVRS